MASHQRPRLTLVEQVRFRLKQVIFLLRVIGKVAWTATIRRYAGWVFKRYLAVNALRNGQFSLRERYYLEPPTGEAIAAYSKTHGLHHTSSTIEVHDYPTVTLHEIHLAASQVDKSCLLYFHGGGFVLPISGPGHVPFAISCGQAAGVGSVFFLEYTLAPALQYPGQLAQAVATVRYLLQQRQFSSDQIVIGGDSAGGNLALAILAHIKQKHPGIPALEEMIGKQFKAVYMLSPWVTLPSTTKSFRDNEVRDHIEAKKLVWFIDQWKPTSEVWAEPLKAEPIFWHDIAVKKVMLTAGLWECFADDIIDMAGKLRESGANVELIEADKEIHVQPVVDNAMKLPNIGSAQAVIDWLKEI